MKLQAIQTIKAHGLIDDLAKYHATDNMPALLISKN